MQHVVSFDLSLLLERYNLIHPLWIHGSTLLPKFNSPRNTIRHIELILYQTVFFSAPMILLTWFISAQKSPIYSSKTFPIYCYCRLFDNIS
jgi:hypothetical protein